MLASYANIITNGPTPIRCMDATAHVHGDAAFVVCYENVAESWLIATNVFRRDGDAWRLVHHQAGPVPAPEFTTMPDDEYVN